MLLSCFCDCLAEYLSTTINYCGIQKLLIPQLFWAHSADGKIIDMTNDKIFK